MKSYQAALLRYRYAQAALRVHGLTQPRLSECASHLAEMDEKRQQLKGRSMTEDHLTQEAVEWARKWTA